MDIPRFLSMATLTTPGGGPLLAVKRDIETMKIRGAGEIGKQAVHGLAAAGRTFRGASLAAFREEVVAAARLLASARPTAVTLRNGLNSVLRSMTEAGSVHDAQDRLDAAARAYAAHVDDAKREIARLALPLFRADDVVLTHCHSTAAGGAIIAAAQRYHDVRVFSTETRPFRQGLLQSTALAQAGVDVTLVVDSAVTHLFATAGVTRVVVGADTVAADGSLYNKIGTHQVALIAHHFRVPVLVCAERDKFSPYTLRGEAVTIEERDPAEVAAASDAPGVKIRNPVFDRTPPDLIQTYVTEKGLVEPPKVRAFIEKEFGGEPALV